MMPASQIPPFPRRKLLRSDPCEPAGSAARTPVGPAFPRGRGETGLGIAKLRELSGTSALAAGELILLLERSAGPDAAISEAEQQAARWQYPPLQIQYVDLLGSNGRFPDADAYIDRAIPDTTLPADVRVKLCAWYATHQAKQGSLAAAAATARLGLAVAADTDLAWQLVIILYNDGNLGEARTALDKYRLEPGTEEEMRLWMQLHVGVDVDAAAGQRLGGVDGLLAPLGIPWQLRGGPPLFRGAPVQPRGDGGPVAVPRRRADPPHRRRSAPTISSPGTSASSRPGPSSAAMRSRTPE